MRIGGNAPRDLPSVYRGGRFVGNNTGRAFSSLALDQMHEQLICAVKGDGGIIGITEDPEALRTFMIVCPELARLTEEFEQSPLSKEYQHHEQYKKFQDTFKEDANSLMRAFSEQGNPFMEDTGKLISLETSNIMDKHVVHTVKTILERGKEEYDSFYIQRIKKIKVPWSITIHLNKLPLFKKRRRTKGSIKLKL